MKDTINYSEFLFLSAIARRDSNFLGVEQLIYLEMVIATAEDNHIVFERHDLQLFIGRLRGEIALDYPHPTVIHHLEWANPRAALRDKLIGNAIFQTRITFRGLCRLEALRELLKRERILEPFGALLDMRYFPRDLAAAIQRPPEIPVSVLRLDLDNFKKINDKFGHSAGDVVMKSYLTTVRETLGSSGEAYRGRGDEVAAIIIGQEHAATVAIAEKIRSAVAAMACKYIDIDLPKVTTSIGVVTAPPEQRDKAIEDVADARQLQAKKNGKNCVVSS